MSDLTITFYPHGEIAVDSGDHTTYTLGGYSGQLSPTPEVYVNGVLEPGANYTFNVGSTSVHCSVTFDSALAATDVVTVTYKWKYAVAANEEVTLYDFTKTSNVREQVDVNGHVFVTEGYNKYTDYQGILEWSWASYAWWETLRAFSEIAGATLDVERTSLSAVNTGSITGLYIKNFPAWSEEPQVVGYMRNLHLELTKVS